MRKSALASILLIAAIACAAQEGPKLRVLVVLESLSQLDAEDCAQALSAAISRSPLVGEVRLAAEAPEVAEEAGKLGFDLALYACVLQSASGVRLWWRVLSASSGDEIGYGAVDAAAPGARDLQDAFWTDLLASLEAAIGTVGPPRGVRLVVTGPPGAVVKGFGKDPVALSGEGAAELTVAAPATYAWSADAKGYDGAAGTAAILGQESASLDLAMTRQYPWTVEVGLCNGAFLDYWVSRRFRGDGFFLCAGLRQYMLGISLRDAGPGDALPYFVSFPLIQPGLGGGILFGKPGHPLRAYAGALATARLVMPEGVCMFIDPVAPLCLEPFGGIEWRPLRRCGFFAELYAGFYPFADGPLFSSTVGESQGPSPGYVYGDGWVLGFPFTRFGARFYL
jgi:hypothetical protein